MFGAVENFMVRFNPSAQKKLMRAKAGYVDCKKYNFPTIEQLITIYGDQAIETWISIQINDLNNFCGVKQKMTTTQIEDVATIIQYKYGILNISEINLFLLKFKAGEFGQFYGVVDPIVITTALGEFMRERAAELAIAARKEAESELQEKRNEWSKNAITYEEYRKQKKQNIKNKVKNQLSSKIITRYNRKYGK